jgi:hypothetical protein
MSGGVVLLHAETPMHDSHQRDELNSIFLDEKDVAIANLEGRRIGRVHCAAIHRASEHPDRIIRAERALDRVFDRKSDVGNDVTVRAFTGPFGFRFLDRALENHFSLVDQLVEGGRNNGGRRDCRQRQGEEANQEE